MIGRLEALCLLAVGLCAGAFALLGDYELLMNPTFRWVTISGAVLVTAMGLALLFRPRRAANPSALLVFGALIVLTWVADPFAGGVSSLLQAAGSAPPLLEREGYDLLPMQDLFEGLSKEADVPQGTYVFRGVVHRTAALDADGHIVLIEPLMACCIADAIALGIRVDLGGTPAPEGEQWIYAYGTLRNLDVPIKTAPFRKGAVLFSAISRTRIVELDEIVTFQSLLADLSQKLPDRCAIFEQALQDTGVMETLREAGPFTVFAPMDVSFDRMPEAQRTSLFDPANRDALARYLRGFIVPKRYYEANLFDLTQLTTLSGRKLSVEAVNGKLRIEGARILFGDDVAKNGVLHIVHPAWLPE